MDFYREADPGPRAVPLRINSSYPLEATLADGQHALLNNKHFARMERLEITDQDGNILAVTLRSDARW